MKLPLEIKILKDSKLLIYLPALLFVFTLISYKYVPPVFSSFFTDNDSFRWFPFFILYMGSLFSLYSFVLIKKNIEIEYKAAGVFVTLFAGMIVFVSFQRFTSGIRFLETYNEIMSIRIANLKSIYPDPEVYPVGTVYTPLYFIVSGILYKLLPSGFAYGRVVSLISTLVTVYYVYNIGQYFYRNKKSGLWASVLFLSTYVIINKSYDKCFVDSLLMCLLTITMYYYLLNTQRGDFFAILFCSLACFTKQTALYPLILVIISSIIAKRKLTIYTPIILSIIIACILMYITGGQLWIYLAVYPIGHGMQKTFPTKVMFDIFVLQICIWIGVVYSFFKNRFGRIHFYILVSLATSLFGIFKGGGGYQAMLPLEPVICIAACHFLRNNKFLLVIQIIIGLYNPFTTLYPYKSIRYTNLKIKELVNSTTGDVWLPMETNLYHGTQKNEWDNFCALFGPVWSGFGVPERLLNALKYKKFDLIIIRNNSMGLFYLFHPDIKGYIKKNYLKDNRADLVIFRPRRIEH